MSAFFSTPTNDFIIDANHRLTFETDPVVCAAISLKNKFQLFLGEWFMDIRIGVPMLQVVMVKNPDVNIIRRLFLRVISSEPLVVGVPDIELTYNVQERTLFFFFSVKMQDGRSLQGGSAAPFIITPEEQVSN